MLAGLLIPLGAGTQRQESVASALQPPVGAREFDPQTGKFVASSTPTERPASAAVAFGRSASSIAKKVAVAPAPLGHPILNLGLPKSASTSMLDFFTCSGLKTSHYTCQDNNGARNIQPYTNASKVAEACLKGDICRCKVFGNCTSGHTTAPTETYPLHHASHYCKTYGMCNNLPRHLRPMGWENVTERDPFCGSCIMRNVMAEEAPLGDQPRDSKPSPPPAEISHVADHCAPAPVWQPAAAPSTCLRRSMGLGIRALASCRSSGRSIAYTMPTPTRRCCCPLCPQPGGSRATASSKVPRCEAS